MKDRPVDLIVRHSGTPAEKQAKTLLALMKDPLRWHVPAPVAGQHVFRDADHLLEVWLSHGGKPEDAPKLDFATQMLVAIFSDAGTYRVAPGIVRVVVHQGRVRVVHATSSRPWNMINPMAIVTVSRAEGAVDFLAYDSPEAKELETLLQAN